MEINGTIYPLTIDLTLSQVPFVFVNVKGIRIQGSIVGSRHTLRSLMQFAVEKKITPTKVTFPLNEDGIEKAMETLRDGKMRYRGVLVQEQV